MTTAVRVAAVVLLGLVSVGCGVLEEREASAWLEEARVPLKNDDCDTAWPILKRIGDRHPRTEAASEAFPLAAFCFARAYHYHRFSDPESPWITEEPGFMFDWIAVYFGDEFPQRKVDTLLHGLNYSFGQRFITYCAERPNLAIWEITVEEDNGIIERVEAQRRETAGDAAAGSGR